MTKDEQIKALEHKLKIFGLVRDTYKEALLLACNNDLDLFYKYLEQAEDNLNIFDKLTIKVKEYRDDKR